MKKTIFTRLAMAAITVAAIGCQREDALVDGGQNGSSANLVPFTINATLEGGETKTTLVTEGGKVYWESGDAITVLAVGENAAVTSYKFTTENEGAEATFTGGVELAKDYYVIYPHTDKDRLPYLYAGRKGWEVSVVDSKLKVYFPSMQKLSPIGESATPLDAYSVGVVAEDGTVAMKNLGGLIEFNIPETGIEHVILYGNAGEDIVGNAYVTFGEDDGLPLISSLEGSNMVRVVPAAGGTFAVGKYYINVLPVTFSAGITVVFTKKDGTWAQVRSGAQFVVERSKISPLPEISGLSFGGKVINLNAVNENGVAAHPFTTNLPASDSNDFKGEEESYTTNAAEGETGYVFKFCGALRHYRSSQLGWCYGKGVDDYLEVPALEGYALNKVVVRSSAEAAGCGCPVIQNVDKTIVDGCAVWDDDVKPFGIDHVWSFAGEHNTPYRIARTTSVNEYTSFHQIRLYYAEASSVKPLITSVTTKEVETEHKGKVTFKGVFSAVDYQTSLLSCGFDYRPVGKETWERVSLDPTANDFSYEVEIDSDEDYEYRAWTKVNKTEKTVYGDWVQFNARKIVLHLVFDDNYYTREDKYNLLREWGWGTNSNTEKENLNDETYNYNYNGTDYPFTFWSYRPTATQGGYALYVTSGQNGNDPKVYGLSLSYTKATEGFDPVAWMKLPGPQDFKLTNLNTTLNAAFAGTISTAVGEDGRPVGDPVASFDKKYKNIKLTLNGTKAGTRYYFCTDDDERPTLRNLTLTYLYAPAE